MVLMFLSFFLGMVILNFFFSVMISLIRFRLLVLRSLVKWVLGTILDFLMLSMLMVHLWKWVNRVLFMMGFFCGWIGIGL